MATSTQPIQIESKRVAGIPWYLWCSAVAVTSVTIGGQWDVSWHRSIGRDTFWTPAHMAIYLCGVLAGIACGYLIFNTTFRRPPQMVASSVHVLGFTAPLGAFLAAWGGVTMLTSAPFDNWWHNAYGLDVKIVSPPHTLLMLGIVAVKLGTVFLILAAMNRVLDQSLEFRRLQRLLLYVAGVLLMFVMFFNMEYTWNEVLHQASPYVALSISIPLLYAAVWKASRHRWSSTVISAIYMIGLIAIILILPLFPAVPKLGPVYQTVTHFIPPKFPVLLIVPAMLLDLLWSRFGHRNKLIAALAGGPLFVLSLLAAEWPFADFLMTKASENRFFATGYYDYGTPSWSAEVRHQFVRPEYGAALWHGLGFAMLYAAIGIWLGLTLGNWMRSVKR
jgi:hypothetical protein